MGRTIFLLCLQYLYLVAFAIFGTWQCIYFTVEQRFISEPDDTPC